ncbi:MAG: hypothetical protein AB8F95_06525 [Bacteroidia bacterium]
MRRLWVIPVLICVSLMACTQSDANDVPAGFQQVTVDSLYTVLLPSALNETRDMHDYAELQYRNVDIHFYVLGITSPKARLGDVRNKRLKLSAFMRFMEDDVRSFVDSLTVCGESSWRTNQPKSSVAAKDFIAKSSFFGDQHELFYRVTAVETPDSFYGLIVWTPYSNHMERWDWIERISHSFKPV